MGQHNSHSGHGGPSRCPILLRPYLVPSKWDEDWTRLLMNLQARNLRSEDLGVLAGRKDHRRLTQEDGASAAIAAVLAEGRPEFE